MQSPIPPHLHTNIQKRASFDFPRTTPEISSEVTSEIFKVTPDIFSQTTSENFRTALVPGAMRFDDRIEVINQSDPERPTTPELSTIPKFSTNPVVASARLPVSGMVCNIWQKHIGILFLYLA